MSKKFDFEVARLSLDQISKLTTEELYRQISRVKRVIKEAISFGRDTLPHEVEYCYLDHERQMRYRRDVHNDRTNHRPNRGN